MMETVLMMLVIVAVVVYVGYPLANPRRYSLRTFTTMGDAQYEQLASAREQAFDALRDFEFDHATGKLSGGDYQSLRARYEARAANVLQQLDALGAKSSGTGDKPGRARRHKSAVPAARVCPRCQRRAESSDRFCMACGTPLTEGSQ